MKKIEIEVVEDSTGFTMNCHNDDTHATKAEVMFWNAVIDLINSANRFDDGVNRAARLKVNFPLIKFDGGAK